MSQPVLDQDLWDIDEALLDSMSDEEVNRFFGGPLRFENIQFRMVPLTENAIEQKKIMDKHESIRKEFHEPIWNLLNPGPVISYKKFLNKYERLNKKFHNQFVPQTEEERKIKTQISETFSYVWSTYTLKEITNKPEHEHVIVECERRIFNWDTSRYIAFGSAFHPRLGNNSPLQQLPEDIFAKIKGYF